MYTHQLHNKEKIPCCISFIAFVPFKTFVKKNITASGSEKHHIHISLTLLHSEWPKLNGALAVLSAIGLSNIYKLT